MSSGHSIIHVCTFTELIRIKTSYTPNLIFKRVRNSKCRDMLWIMRTEIIHRQLTFWANNSKLQANRLMIKLKSGYNSI